MQMHKKILNFVRFDHYEVVIKVMFLVDCNKSITNVVNSKMPLKVQEKNIHLSQ